MHVLRRLDRKRIAIDIMVNAGEPGHYDAEARALGAKVIPCTQHARPWVHLPKFLRLLHLNGPYDIVHSHVGRFSGVIMLLARLAGVPVRIAHGHNSKLTTSGASRRLYRAVTSALVRQHATAGLAVSAPAAVALFGERWRRDPRWRVLYLGIDLAPFRNGREVASTRAGLGLPNGAPVIGHVGRFAPQKNHDFLVDIFAQVARRRPEARLLLVGDGTLRESVELKVDAADLREQVTFAGVRSDVPDLLRAMDVFVLPSHHEGLPLVILEAQAAGVPAIVSARITEEMDAVASLVGRVTLEEPAARWADLVLGALERRSSTVDAATALDVMTGSPFNVENSVKQLAHTYEALTARPK